MALTDLPSPVSGHHLEFRTGAAREGRDGDLSIRATARPDDVFDRFYDAYDRAFVLPAEKEDREGFLRCLALNEGAAYERLADHHGPYREWVVLAEDAGEVVGGANFICHPLAVGEADAAWRLAMHLNYIFVAAAQRGRGHFRLLLDACVRTARATFAGASSANGCDGGANASVLVFFELNDPLRMDPADYALDSTHAGLDQFDRVGIWGRLGARIVCFPYRQPPLSTSQPADEALVLGVLGAASPVLDACLLGAHLERFFAVSVLKGGDPRTLPVARSQLALCEEECRAGHGFALHDPLPHLDALRRERRAVVGGVARRRLQAALAALAASDRDDHGRGD